MVCYGHNHFPSFLVPSLTTTKSQILCSLTHALVLLERPAPLSHKVTQLWSIAQDQAML